MTTGSLSRRVTLNLVCATAESGLMRKNDIYSRYLDLNAPNTAIQQTPPSMHAMLALDPQMERLAGFTDPNNRKS
jgi:hypothetical protein